VVPSVVPEGVQREFWLSEEQLAKIEPLLPTDTRGKDRVDDRLVSGMIHVLKSGGRWIDAPPVYGRRANPVQSLRAMGGQDPSTPQHQMPRSSSRDGGILRLDAQSAGESRKDRQDRRRDRPRCPLRFFSPDGEGRRPDHVHDVADAVQKSGINLRGASRP
jgi:hypothetical protein